MVGASCRLPLSHPGLLPLGSISIGLRCYPRILPPVPQVTGSASPCKLPYRLQSCRLRRYDHPHPRITGFVPYNHHGWGIVSSAAISPRFIAARVHQHRTKGYPRILPPVPQVTGSASPCKPPTHSSGLRRYDHPHPRITASCHQ